MTQPFRGIYSIAQTPFSDTGEILWDEFEYECDWIVRTGAHGYVYPVMVSEFTVLSNSAVRGRGALRLDDHDSTALDYALSLVEPYYRVKLA